MLVYEYNKPIKKRKEVKVLLACFCVLALVRAVRRLKR